MKIAVLSDVHGNCPALRKVLEDAEKRGVDEFIIAGDYCLSGAWPDECIKTLMEIPDKVMIRGNEESYLENLIGKDQIAWTDGQMQISYYCFRNIDPGRLDYILSLPHTAEFERNGVKIHLAHSSVSFIGDYEFAKFGPAKLSKKYSGTDTSSEVLRKDVHEMLDADPEFTEKVDGLESGIYVFGHSHVQWSYKSKNVLLVNPGSCGLPLDAIKDSVPYSIITISAKGETSVEEIRIPFPMLPYVEELKKTTQYAEANVWTKVIIKELLTSREHLYYFLDFAEKYAEDIGDDRRPFSIETWEGAYKAWEEQIIVDTDREKIFLSEFCDVFYVKEKNIVLVHWKKYCELDQYRTPLECALKVIKEHPGCNYVADTRDGFEDNPLDTKWVAEYFMPKAKEYGCEIIYFIIDKNNSLKEELEGQEKDSSALLKFRYVYGLEEI